MELLPYSLCYFSKMLYFGHTSRQLLFRNWFFPILSPIPNFASDRSAEQRALFGGANQVQSMEQNGMITDFGANENCFDPGRGHLIIVRTVENPIGRQGSFLFLGERCEPSLDKHTVLLITCH